jgi:hypothetical protein
VDLLSVLIHELGHVLGAEHSDDAYAALSAVLQPGTRRLPSETELAVWRAGLVDVPPQAAHTLQRDDATPTPPGGRRLAQALHVINPTLLSGRFTEASGWDTDGQARIADGRATLTEFARTQTGLSQGFALRPEDRFVSFTLTGLQLTDSAGPDDAFEVALLDATTRTALVSTDALGGGDAFLNLQAGLEYRSDLLRRTDHADGSRTYVLDVSGLGQGSGVVLAFDLIGFGGADSQVTVRDVRLGRLPQLTDDHAITAEDTPVVIDALANDLGADLTAFQPIVVAAPAHGALTVNPDGTFTFRPHADYHGDDRFSYQLTAGGGALDSNVAEVSLTISPVNDLPFARDLQVGMLEDGVLEVDLLALAGDVDSTALSARIESGPTHGQVELRADGKLRYTPTPDFNGSDTFTFHVSDGELESNPARIRIEIAPVNDAPVARDLAVTTAEDTPITFDLLPQAADADADPLSVTILDGPAYGNLIVHPDGSITYRPDPNTFGSDRFTWRAGDGTADSTPATVTLEITPINDAPVFSALSPIVQEDGMLELDLRDLVTDVDSVTLTTQIVSAPAHGGLTLTDDGRLRYVPPRDYFGTDTFTLSVSDGERDAQASFTVSITPLNDVPVAHAQSATVDENTTLTGQVFATDTESDPLIYELSAAPAHGQLELDADGRFRYTPQPGYAGSDAFSFRAFDGQAWSASAEVALTVRSLNHAPQFMSAPSAQFLLTTARTGAARDSMFEVQGSLGQSVKVRFDWVSREAMYDNELGLYAVDDASGRVAGLAPGDAGYAAAALATGRVQTLFTSGQGGGARTELALTAGRLYVFYLIQNSTREAFLARNPDNALGCGPLAFFSLPEANPDAVDHLRASIDSAGALTLAWEDLTGGGDRDFNDAIVRTTGLTLAQPNLFRHRVEAEDPDGDPITYRLLEGPAGATLDPLTGELRFAPAAPGRYRFRLEASDGKGARSTQEFTLDVERVQRILRVRGSECADDIAITEQDGITRVTIDGRTRAYSALDGIYAEGLAGDDCLRLSGLTVDTLVDAGAGNDRMDGSQVSSARLIVYAGLGNDSVKGGAGDDYIDGGAGNDTLEGNAGDEVLIGGAGSDTLKGGAGDDILVKGSGKDKLDGGPGDDMTIDPNQLPGYTAPMPIIDWAAALPPADGRTRTSWVVEFVSSGAQLDPNAGMVVRI